MLTKTFYDNFPQCFAHRLLFHTRQFLLANNEAFLKRGRPWAESELPLKVKEARGDP